MNNVFFSFFGPELVGRLEAAADVRAYRRDEILFREGDPADGLYLVLEGAVRLIKLDPAGKTQTVAFVGANDYFGEFGILDGQPRSAGAIAAEDGTRLAKIPAATVLNILQRSPLKSVLSLAMHIIAKVREFNARFAEEQLRKERMTLVGEMSRSLFHDFRNPLSVIRMGTHILLQEHLSADASEVCHLLNAQVERMESMATDVLEFSRGAPQVRLIPTDIRLVLDSLEKLNRDPLKHARIDLVVEPVSQVVAIDANKLLRALQNLVGNAAEAIKKKPGLIRVSAEVRQDRLVIRVADNGPGIPEALRASVFEPFTTQGKPKGTGLGMAIARSFVEAHQGSLTFETATDRGTTFHIELPVPKPATG